MTLNILLRTSFSSFLYSSLTEAISEQMEASRLLLKVAFVPRTEIIL